MNNIQTIKLGHSPDADDAFMFWALAEGKVNTNLSFEHILKDIQTLNEWAREGRLETTAVSVHAMAYVADKYALMTSGASFGDGYGPKIIAKRQMSKEELLDTVIAIPGKLTSAYLAMCLYMNNPKVEVYDFDAIIDAVLSDKVKAGLIIHEAQLTHAQSGLVQIVDLGEWWKNETGGLPLPLGVNVIRKNIPDEIRSGINSAIKSSIELGLAHRKEALDYALSFGRGLDAPLADEFVGMYVNDWTLDMGQKGIESIQLFLKRGAEIGLIPKVDIEIQT